MNTKTAIALTATCFALLSSSARAQDFQSGEDVAREALARARADKAVNDRIVEAQRAREKASPSPSASPSHEHSKIERHGKQGKAK